MSKIQQATALLKQSADVEKRRKAIKYLAKSGDADALPQLKWTSENDPDPQLRSLAAKGSQYLQKQLNEQPSEAVKVDELFTFDDDVEEETTYHESSDSNEGFGFDENFGDDYDYNEDVGQDSGPISYDARSRINMAMDYHIEGDDFAALEALIKALEIDPRTRDDSAAQNIAAEVTGLRGEDAMRSLETPSKRAVLLDEAEGASGTGGKKRSRTQSWGSTWADIGIYALINTVGVVAVTLLTAARFTPLLEQFQQTQQYADIMVELDGIDIIGVLLDSLQGNLLAVIANSISNSVSNVIGLLITAFILHFVIATIFNGKRGAAVTVDRVTNVSSVFTALTYIIVGVGLFALPTDLNAYLNGELLAGEIVAANNLFGVIMLLSIVQYIVMGVVLGNAQEVGAFNGCLSLIIPNAIIFGLVCACSFVLGIAAGTV